MSVETRSSSALFKRAEQLKRWEESETNRVPTVSNRRNKKIQFSAGCVFLAACAAGDKEEVLRLLQKGADIDTANVDGLTALHQACIDDNLDMVEFLVEHGADVNRGDNEGWTPLHATASCGFISIAKYLIENGGNVAAVNNDAELPVDIAESDEMEDMLQQSIESRGIDCDEARNEEERLMLEDAKAWLNSGELNDEPHPKTGARALHVASAKGYIKVMRVLLQGNADVNAQDFDGWTPLHAAAHWGQKEACEMLVENFCDMEMKNYVGQTAFDIADPDLIPVLEELQKRQAAMQRDHAADNAILLKKGVNASKRRSSITRMSVTDKTNLINKDASAERQILDQTISEEGNVDKIRKVKVEIEPESDKDDTSEQPEINEVEKKNRVNRDDSLRIPSTLEVNKSVPNIPSSPSKTPVDSEDPSSWRRPGSIRNRGLNGQEDISNKTATLSPSTSDKESSPQKVTTPTGVINRAVTDKPEVSVRRTRSFEADEKVSRNDNDNLVASTSDVLAAVSTASTTTTTITTNASPTRLSIPTANTPLPSNQVRRSFVPPVRDEESETQRKAHAKRVRETRRSTQGVTLEEIKSAEQLVKKKNQQQLQQATQQLNNSEPFLLEDARSRTSVNDTATATTYVRRSSANTPPRPSSAPVDTSTADTTVTIALRRPSKPPDDKEQDKENDIRNAQATQGVIQRRRRPKRRSTGVVHVDKDEIDPDRLDSPGRGDTGDSADVANDESGGEWSQQSSRLGSPACDLSNSRQASTHLSSETSENGEIDYKKLYEASLVENERLREKLQKTEDALNEARLQVEKNSVLPLKNSLSEMEKRERRAMERKLSEMEEELKQLQKLKAENERLKAENRALTRVVSKLTNSANATK